MKKTKRELLVLAAATTVALLMGVTVQAKGDEKVLNFGCQMYTDGCVNSANDENSGWNAMRYGIAEALFKFDDNMEVIPWLAESYEVNDEHTEWTIKLKDGIKFSDGCDLTPTKVKEYFDHMKEVGPSGSAKPEKYLEFEAEVTVDDDANTINIKTSKPYANLVGQLCHPTMGITDVEHIENYDNGIIGTGPYKIEEFNGVGVGYTLAANEYYREDVPYDKINLLFMGDNSAKTMALQSGQVDLVENITNVADIQDFQDSDDFTVDIASGVRCGFAWMNFDGVLGNKTLRQAILMAIDYDTICNSRTIGGLYTPGFSVLPSTLNYDYDKLENPYTYDPEKAKELLTEAGYPDGFSCKLLSSSTYAFHEQTAICVQASLEAVGIDVEVELPDWATRIERSNTGDYDLMVSGTTGNIVDMDWCTNYYESGDVRMNSCPGFADAEIDELLEKGRTTLDETERAAIYDQFRERALELSPFVFINFREQVFASSDKVHGFKNLDGILTYLSGLTLQDTYVEE